MSTGIVTPSEIVSGAPGIALLFAILSFIGFEATAVFRDEARDPLRTIPRATYLALASSPCWSPSSPSVPGSRRDAPR